MPELEFEVDLTVASNKDYGDEYKLYIIGPGETEGEFLVQFCPASLEPALISVLIIGKMSSQVS